MGAEPTTRLGKLINGRSPLSHAECIKTVDQLDLVALCDVDNAKVTKFKEYYNVQHGFTDFRLLIDEIEPDVISIATRTESKEAIIEYAVQKGVRGIYVEKPLATSLIQCERILKLIDENNVELIYGTQRRGALAFRRAKEQAHSGDYGNIKSINIEYGNNLLLWSISHISDLIVYLTNSSKIYEISAICEFPKESYNNNVLDADPFVESAMVSMDNGIKSYITPGSGNVRIFMDNGIIMVNSDGYSIDTFFEGEFKNLFTDLHREFTEPSKSGTQQLFIDLADSILSTEPVVKVSSAELLCGTEILMGMAESALRNGMIVHTDDIRRDLIVTGRFGDLYA